MEGKPRRATTTNESDKFIVRLPDGMRARIAAEATRNNRTMNAEVVARLEGSFSLQTNDSLAVVATRLERELAAKEFEMEFRAAELAEMARVVQALVSGLSPDAAVPGDPQGRTATKWRKYASKAIEGSEGVTERIAASATRWHEANRVLRAARPASVIQGPEEVSSLGDDESQPEHSDVSSKAGRRAAPNKQRGSKK